MSNVIHVMTHERHKTNFLFYLTYSHGVVPLSLLRTDFIQCSNYERIPNPQSAASPIYNLLW
jgi:hypothetical protein